MTSTVHAALQTSGNEKCRQLLGTRTVGNLFERVFVKRLSPISIQKQIEFMKTIDSFVYKN